MPVQVDKKVLQTICKDLDRQGLVQELGQNTKPWSVFFPVIDQVEQGWDVEKDLHIKEPFGILLYTYFQENQKNKSFFVS